MMDEDILKEYKSLLIETHEDSKKKHAELKDLIYSLHIEGIEKIGEVRNEVHRLFTSLSVEIERLSRDIYHKNKEQKKESPRKKTNYMD